MKVGEIARRLLVSTRDVRYVLERGGLPDGLPSGPGRGMHRDLDPAQTFWLAVVLVFKRSGVGVPEAKAMADLARTSLASLAQGHRLDPGFDPFAGRLVATKGWVVEMSDADAVRVLYTLTPGVERPVQHFAWCDRADPTRSVAVWPAVTLRLDVSRLAQLLAE